MKNTIAPHGTIGRVLSVVSCTLLMLHSISQFSVRVDFNSGDHRQDIDASSDIVPTGLLQVQQPERNDGPKVDPILHALHFMPLDEGIPSIVIEMHERLHTNNRPLHLCLLSSQMFSTSFRISSL